MGAPIPPSTRSPSRAEGCFKDHPQLGHPIEHISGRVKDHPWLSHPAKSRGVLRITLDLATLPSRWTFQRTPSAWPPCRADGRFKDHLRFGYLIELRGVLKTTLSSATLLSREALQHHSRLSHPTKLRDVPRLPSTWSSLEPRIPCRAEGHSKDTLGSATLPSRLSPRHQRVRSLFGLCGCVLNLLLLCGRYHQLHETQGGILSLSDLEQQSNNEDTRYQNCVLMIIPLAAYVLNVRVTGFVYEKEARNQLKRNGFKSSPIIAKTSKSEKPIWPMRVWIAGYDIGCVLNLLLLCGRYHQLHVTQGGVLSLSDLEQQSNNEDTRVW
ncbi:hypothetical protein Fmac_008000 [Flemingia macrophylla]|uniref:Uncharacterized protein n=1 Tax=Flemingia macrophylla TaxID=520843 RepID=A0ABD1MW56_9FABA